MPVHVYLNVVCTYACMRGYASTCMSVHVFAYDGTHSRHPLPDSRLLVTFF